MPQIYKLILHLKFRYKKRNDDQWWSHLSLPVTFIRLFLVLCLLRHSFLQHFHHTHTYMYTCTHTHTPLLHLKSPKVSLFNLNWHNRYWILLHTSNEYGYTYTYKQVGAHTCTHKNTHPLWLNLHLYLLTPPSVLVDASCCYYPHDLQDIKAGKCVLTDTSAAEMFYQEK